MSRRAPKSEGPRTTLRLPDALAEVVERMARELDISHNDALLRLANSGARVYEQERDIALLREQRWAGVLPGAGPVNVAGFPSPEEARAAILSAGDEPPTRPA